MLSASFTWSLNIHVPLYWCQPSASRADNQQPSLQSSDKHHHRVVREILFNVIFFLFFGLFLSLENKVVIVPGADNHFLFQFVWHASRAVLLFALRCLGTSQSGHPTKTTREKEGGRRASITLCTAVMPIYSPWHLQGHALTSAGISPPLYSHSCVSPPLWGNRTKFLVHYKSFREAPVDAWPRLDCRDCCSAALPSRGAGSDSLHGSRDCRGCLIKYMLPGKMKSSCSLLVLKMKGPPLQAVLRQSSIM